MKWNAMRISADTSHLRNSLTPQHTAGDLPLEKKQVTGNLAPAPLAPRSPSKDRISPSVSYSRNVSPYHQALRAYQEASRFENNPTVPLRVKGNVVVGDIRDNESALTGILRDEPDNSSAWYDLGLLYAGQGDRNKVSAVYQVLQKLNPVHAEGFSTTVGLHEKLLLDVG